MHFIHYSHSDLSKPVASTEHVMQIAEHWAQDGHRVTVVVPAKGEYRRASQCRFEYVPFVDLRGLREATFELAALVRVLWLAFRERVDAFYWRRHGLDPVPALVRLLTGIPVVTEINGLRTMYEFERGIRHFRFWDALAFRPLEWANFEASEWIMPLSTAQRDGIAADYPRLAGRLTLQSTGLDFERFRPMDRAACRERLGLSPDARVVVWVGYFFPWGGLEVLVDAAPQVRAACPGTRFALLGEGHHRPEVERRVREAGLAEAFLFPGFVEKEDLPWWYGAADVCVAPYRRERLQAEGFPPYKVLEYLASGRPVVATRGGGMIRWVEEEGLGALVPPEEPAALAQALTDWLTNPNRAARAGERAARVLREKIPGWREVAREIVSRLESPAARPLDAAVAAAAAGPRPVAASGRTDGADIPGKERDPSVPPRVSIIIPALDRTRDEMLAALQRQLECQRFRDFEVLLIRGENRQGRAINRGAAAARGEILVTLDDDTQMGNDDVLGTLVDVLDRHSDVGMVGAATEVPPDASWFVRRAHREIPRRLFPTVDRVTDSDMVQHPCLAIRKELFHRIGGEDEELVRGLDPILREKVRRAGYRVVMAPGAWIYHLLPPTLAAVLRMYWRNGAGSAFAQARWPERILELGSGFEGDDFVRTRPFPYRVGRRLLRLAGSFLTGRWIEGSTSLAYTLGFVAETLRSRRGRA